MIDGTICIVVAMICLTSIQIYRLSIKKSVCETDRAKALTEMYKAEKEARLKPSPGPKR